MNSRREVEFAACLLTIGGPPKLIRKKEGALVTTVGHMHVASQWYKEHVEPVPTGEPKYFHAWWVAYKDWLMENRNE